MFLLLNTGREKNVSSCWDYNTICRSRVWGLLVLQERRPYKTSGDASSKRDTTILACNIHHLGEWYLLFSRDAQTYLVFGTDIHVTLSVRVILPENV